MYLTLLKSFLTFITGPALKYILAAIFLLFVSYECYHHYELSVQAKITAQAKVDQDKADALTNQRNLKAAEDANAANLLAVQQLQAENEKQAEITTTLTKQLTIQKATTQSLLNQIANSKPSDDAPLAPVLKSTLKALQ